MFCLLLVTCSVTCAWSSPVWKHLMCSETSTVSCLAVLWCAIRCVFGHVSGYISSCVSRLFYFDMSYCNFDHIQLRVSHALMIGWHSAMRSATCLWRLRHILLSHVLLSPAAGAWFGHVVYAHSGGKISHVFGHVFGQVFIVRWCAQTCFVTLSQLPCWWCAWLHFLLLVCLAIRSHVLTLLRQSCWRHVWSSVLTSEPTPIWRVLDVFFILGHVLDHMFSYLLLSTWTSPCPHGWSCLLLYLIECHAHVFHCMFDNVFDCIFDPTCLILFLQLLSEMSILQLVPSMLKCSLFLNPALAVGGRRLLASRVSSHLDAVLSVFVSQRARPHFLVDEPRVPVCTGSNSVSFQHTTLLWNGRKSSWLVCFFPERYFLRIYKLTVRQR